ncbi:MAG: hypothetical protein R3C11_00905 [Planctomycetaceae bacterium]
MLYSPEMGNPAAWTATMDVGGRQTAIARCLNMAGALRGGFIMPIVLGYLIGDIKRTEGGGTMYYTWLP